MKRLQPSMLGQVRDCVQLPSYDRSTVRPGIVHLGIGAFHRAHQAVYTEDAMANSGGDWGIIGVSLRSATVARQLLPQDGLYSVMSENAGGQVLRVIGAIQDVLVAPENCTAVVAAIARPETRVITLTITEKGYSLAADGVTLNRQDQLVRADLDNPAQPTTAVGLLALGLRARLAAGGAALSILSCDNLSENSRVLRAVLVEYLDCCFPEVVSWLDQSVTFPCSMVDRIVPAMTAAGRQRQADALGLLDEGAVSTEPFSQWLIEDSFASTRPDWESAGAQLVDDILPYENIKLRLLNASHTALACCGLLAGLETVDEVMADAGLRPFIQQLMQQDLVPVLQAPENFDLQRYCEQLLQRFANPCLGHRCAQIVMDSSEKIPQRWLPTLQAGSAPLLLKALAAWCFFILDTDRDIDDPQGQRLRQLRASEQSLRSRLVEVLACARITEDSIAEFDALCAQLEQGVDVIGRKGVRFYVAL